MMKKQLRTLFIAAALGGACWVVADLWLPLNSYKPSEQTTKTIYVVGHGWHTGIVISTNDIPFELLPEKQHFIGEDYLEIGWGDAGFYQAKEISAALALDALFTPTQSVMHVVGFHEDVKRYFVKPHVIPITLSDDELLNMLRHISDTFERGGFIVAAPLKTGRYGNSLFYKAKPTYHLFRTCNNWTAQVLRTANIPVKNWPSGVAEGLLWQLNAMK